MDKRSMPELRDVSQMISLLTNVDVDLRRLEAPWLFDAEIFYVGTYASVDGQIRVLTIMDLPLSASVSALLLRFMPGEAEDAIRDKALNETLMMNLQETLNVYASKLNDSKAPHVVFKALYSNKDLPEAIQALLQGAPCQRADYHVDIPNYFPGNMTIFMLD